MSAFGFWAATARGMLSWRRGEGVLARGPLRAIFCRAAASRPLLIISPCAADRWRWQLCDAAGAREGETTTATLAALPAWTTARLWLAVPGESVLLTSAPVGPGERRLLHQSVPFRMEEAVLGDLEALHFALGPVSGGRVAVAVVAAEALSQWLRTVAAAGREVAMAVPEPLLLPWQPGSWTLRIGADRWLLRFERHVGLALEPAAARLALERALAERGCPERLRVEGDAAQLGGAGALPAALAAVADATAGEAVLPAGFTAAPPLDLRQRRFARRLPWERWVRAWRVPALALAVTVLVQFGSAAWHLQLLQSRQAELQQAIERAVQRNDGERSEGERRDGALLPAKVPRGARVDEEQLRRLLAAQPGGVAQQFLPLLATAGQVLAGAPGVELIALDYRSGKGLDRERELGLTLRAGSFGEVEQLRSGMAEAGLTVSLENSSADGERTRARLRITRSPAAAVPAARLAEARDNG